MNNSIRQLDMIAQVMVLLGSVAHFVMGLSGTSCDFIIPVVSMIVGITMASSGVESYTSNEDSILKQLPTSLYTALSKFDIDSPTTTYAACPACNFTHKAVYDHITTEAIYPDYCTNMVLTSDRRTFCGAELLEMQNGAKHPLKPFVSASLQDYLAHILTDPEIECLCKKACDNAFSNINSLAQLEWSTSVFDSSFIKLFNGPVPGQLFIDRGYCV